MQDEEINDKTRTGATISIKDLEIMQEIAKLKFREDPLNQAWEEAVKCFIKTNIHHLRKRYDEVKAEYD